MIKSLPLHNKKVLVPRGAKEAKSFSCLLEKFGGIPVEIPLIAFRPVKMDETLCKRLENLYTYDWIIFTSKVTFETFQTFVNSEQLKDFPKIAVIGKKTEEVLESNGLKAEFYPSKYVAEVFVEEFLPYVHSGMKILIPKGNLAREHIANTLRKCGAIVDEAIVYENYLPEESKERLGEILAKKQLDILLFTSPSTVDNFMEVVTEKHLEKQIENCLIGCIGPVTEQRLTYYGLPVHASPKVYTVEEMVNSMNAYIIEEN